MREGPCIPHLLITFLGARAELIELGEGLFGQLQHARRRRTCAKNVVGRENGQDVAGGDACLGDVCG